MKYKSCLLVSAMAMATLGAQAKEISVISFGGANKDAQVKAYYQPFSKDTGINPRSKHLAGSSAQRGILRECLLTQRGIQRISMSEPAELAPRSNCGR